MMKWIKKIRYYHLIGLFLGIIVYILCKYYVLKTPSPYDDDIPDQVKDAVLLIISDRDNNDDPYEDTL